MEVGEVRIAEDRDFERLKNLIDSNDGWATDYNKSTIKVWSKATSQTAFKIVKVQAYFKDVKASVLFDVLLDPTYRKAWDNYMIESYDIGHLNPNNDIGYYAAQSPTPLRNRDFVLQRSWLDTGKECYILNHSVFHEKLPPKNGYIRAVSYLTGFVIRSTEFGCEMGYASQCDPKGSLPPWLVNKCTQIFAPKMVKRLYKACLGYEEWKLKHNPNEKPWIHPEQITTPKIHLSQFLKEDVHNSSDSLDDYCSQESSFQERDFVDVSED